MNDIPIIIDLACRNIAGVELSKPELLAIINTERDKLRTRAERIISDNPNVPPHDVVAIVLERMFKAYDLN